MRTALYRHWDEHGQLLYVGISLSAVQRLSQHKYSAGWFEQIATMTIEWFESREAAIEAERVAIQTEHPRHNRAYNAANDNRAQRSPELNAAIATHSRWIDHWLTHSETFTDEQADSLLGIYPELILLSPAA